MNVFETLLPYLISAITGVVGWIVGNQKRKNDFLTELQSSIDLLSERNKTLLQEIVTLRGENVELLSNQRLLQEEIAQLKCENKSLREEVEQLNERLAGVKTITRTKL